MWPFLDPWDVIKMRTEASRWNISGKYGPYGEHFFLTLKKGPTIQNIIINFERDTSSDAEDGRSLSDEEGEHNVKNFMLVSSFSFSDLRSSGLQHFFEYLSHHRRAATVKRGCDERRDRLRCGKKGLKVAADEARSTSEGQETTTIRAKTVTHRTVIVFESIENRNHRN